MIIKIKTPAGVIAIEEKNGLLTRVYLPNRAATLSAVEGGTPVLKEAKRQILEYFDGGRTVFDLPLSFEGCSDFSARVYKELMRVKYGDTATYKNIAGRVGSPKAYRAVGLANNKNPLAIIVPCHRIVGSNGKLVGYDGGLEMKQMLLDLERGG